MSAALPVNRDGNGNLSAEETSAASTRLWYFGMLLIAALAVALFILYPVLAFSWRDKPFFGAFVSQTMVVDAGRPSGAISWPGLDAGLRHRDQIVALNGETLAASPTDYADARAHFQRIWSTLQLGDTVTVTFNRAAGNLLPEDTYCDPVDSAPTTSCTVRYTLAGFPESDFLVFFVIPFVSGLMVLVIGLAILHLRSNQPVALVASLTCLLLAIFMGGVFDLGVTKTFSPVWLAATALLGGTLATLGILFPLQLRFSYRYRFVRYLPGALGIILAALAVYFWYNPDSAEAYSRGAQIATFTAIAGVLTFLVCIVNQRRSAINAVTHDQSNTLLIGLGVVLIPAAIWLGSRLMNAVLPLSIEATMPFFVPAAASIAYAVLQYRRVDTDRVISKGITYSILLIALILGYFLLVLGVSLITRQALDQWASNPLLIALTIFLMSMLFLPVRTRLQERVDRIYFRERRNYQEKTEEFAHKLTSLSGYDQIIAEFKALLENTVKPVSVFVFLPSKQTDDFVAYGKPQPETDVHFSQSSGVVALLKLGDQGIYLEPGRPWPSELRVDRPRLNILRAVFIAGISSDRQLNAFVVIGPPRSGAGRYTFEELRFLINLIGQFGVAIERAAVIESLQRRVRELDVLSQVGQAVNFTIEFDDLLELISAQTNKLIEASNFYIVLRDPTVDQLFFAFFLEDDERKSEKENARWQVGRDLYSEIVRTAQPRRVDDFARELALRGVKIVHENPNLKAWIGVPLIAGPRTLGVVAVGKTRLGETYTDDQLKIFGDIGALAATSLEKARLFNEANMRARQLTVLNEISQQLVATESDVEKLLEIITSSAVDILNAEAGSLLLSVDDESGDLEFRVAVGGSGHELIGSRLPAGKGLAGQVAANGKPVIVNDVAHDARHAGDVSPFKTNSVLAVPMIAKDKVIGVLEVLNKKDGTIFIEQDTELLTTFAGQAAIAIENARLFQMTDLQLSKRVQELEALERIDVELNRTLDLTKVAEITLRWAIANSGATAGVLGLVEDDTPPRLKTVAKYGYEEDDFPAGAEDNYWPLDRGIVKRVMRTRQADLVTDTKIDPDFVPSLRDCLSQITIPMKSGDEIFALLVLETNREPRLNLADWGFAQRLAEHASIAISNALLYDELTQAIESKSEFMGFAAHELKNPLSSVKGYTDVLLSGMTGSLEDQQKNFLNIIRTNADRIQTIINDLRDAAQAEADRLNVELAPISFWHVVIETLRPFQKQLDEKHQEIINSVAEDLPLVMGDQVRLIQVLTNLVSNAHKYSPPESSITIQAKVETDQLDAKGKFVGPVLHVSVSDTGIGMSEEDVARLFKEQYFRSDNPLAREQPGTGLGMMITQNIIQRHHGKIWAESKLNTGSTFHFIVPVATEAEKQRQTETELASD